MAGAKYLCGNCGLESWLPRKSIPCVQCGSENHSLIARVHHNVEKCSECGKEFTPKSTRNKTCSHGCGSAREARMARERLNNSLTTVRCKYCGATFRQRVAGQSACSAASCRKKSESEWFSAYRSRKKKAVEDEFLGPEGPTMPMRKCHERGCNELTYDYRCDGCRAKWRAKNGASGLSGLRELFSGAYLSQYASSNYAS